MLFSWRFSSTSSCGIVLVNCGIYYFMNGGICRSFRDCFKTCCPPKRKIVKRGGYFVSFHLSWDHVGSSFVFEANYIAVKSSWLDSHDPVTSEIWLLTMCNLLNDNIGVIKRIRVIIVIILACWATVRGTLGISSLSEWRAIPLSFGWWIWHWKLLLIQLLLSFGKSWCWSLSSGSLSHFSMQTLVLSCNLPNSNWIQINGSHCCRNVSLPA